MRLIAIVVLLCIASMAWGQPKEGSGKQQKAQPQQDHRGTKKQPLVIEGIPIPKSEAEAREEREQRSHQATVGTAVSTALKGIEKESTATTWLTGGLLFVAFFQLFMFGLQLGFMKKGAKDTRDLAEAARLQSRALVAEKLPVVLWTDWKMVEYVPQTDNVAADPMPPKQVPEECRPVFGYTNTGPTRIKTMYYAIKWEIAKTKEGLKKDPYFGSMYYDGILLEQGQVRYMTTRDKIILTPEQRKSLQEGATLFVYAFLVYGDFLDEGHQIGTIAKWDSARGFVVIQKENYSYQRHEKTYTRQYPKAESGQTVSA